MPKKPQTRTATRCVSAELVGFDLGRGRLSRPGVMVEAGNTQVIADAVDTGRAFVLRRCFKPQPPYTHVVSWPGVGLFLCHLGFLEQVIQADKGGSK